VTADGINAGMDLSGHREPLTKDIWPEPATFRRWTPPSRIHHSVTRI